jgi:hypothetical protein
MSAPDRSRPFHVLMASCNATEPYVHEQISVNDYLSRRAAAYDDRKPGLWSGATSIEIALTKCCDIGGGENDSLEEAVEGALSTEKVMTFLELLVRYCYKAPSRILALAILERTIEKDRLDLLRRNSEFRDSKEVPSCFSRFLISGGLKILNQWLIDAMTPSQKIPPISHPCKKLKSSVQHQASQTHIVTTSPDGPLLKPLLELLEKIPLDKALITSTKINKTIRKLDKQLSNLPKRSTDPHAGGYIVQDIQKAIESLKESWRKEQEETYAKDPFQRIQQELTDRLLVLEEYDAGKIEKPEWLEQFETLEKLAKDKKEFSKMTPEQRNRQLKLLDIQRKREEADKRMEALLVKKRLASKLLHVSSKPKKNLRWKDGKNKGDGSEMEEVFYYPPESINETSEDNEDSDEDMWN